MKRSKSCRIKAPEAGEWSERGLRIVIMLVIPVSPRSKAALHTSVLIFALFEVRSV